MEAVGFQASLATSYCGGDQHRSRWEVSSPLYPRYLQRPSVPPAAERCQCQWRPALRLRVGLGWVCAESLRRQGLPVIDEHHFHKLATFEEMRTPLS